MTNSLSSRRLCLRMFKLSDIDSFLAYRNDPKISLYQGWSGVLAREEARRFITEQSRLSFDTSNEWVQVALEFNGNLIGDVAFNLTSQTAEIGVSIIQQYQRKGFAFEAVYRLLDFLFNERKIHRAVATIDTNNIASVKLFERLGFRREAHYVKSFFDSDLDEWRDEYNYAVLEEEWEGRQ